MMKGVIEKKRILVPVCGQGSIIHIIRTGMLDKMKEFCEPVVALLWKQEDLINELTQKGIETHIIPTYSVSEEYTGLRFKINIWYVNYKLKTPSVSLQEKYLNQFRKNFKRNLIKKMRTTFYKNRYKLQPGFIKKLVKQEESQIVSEPIYATFDSWLMSLNVDGLFTVTPFLQEVELLARILKKQGLPILASIHSFDNVTKRGWPALLFDHYMVWNKYNKAELQRIHPALLQKDAITISGAPQFDFHYNETYWWSKEEWQQKLGLPKDKRVILYSGGSYTLLPDEPQYLKALKEAIESGSVPQDHVILFRCHPLDKVERWKEYVGESPYIVYDYAPNGLNKMDHVNVRREDLVKLMSTLKHTELHINVVSTMCVDGSAFTKPQIGPYYDDVHPATQQLFRGMYFQEHYRPILNSEVLRLAHTKEEYIDYVKQMLKDPGAHTANCKKCVEEIITYTDGQSTNRAVAAIRNFFSE
ncbi:MAG: hypothetical protein JWQ96_3379 [Segetibacter sp.]|nr:hypothetical protein [Segetibacter sp.]